MPTPLVILIGLLAIAVFAGAVVVVIGYRNAPEGKEDDLGFHVLARPPLRAKRRTELARTTHARVVRPTMHGLRR